MYVAPPLARSPRAPAPLILLILLTTAAIPTHAAEIPFSDISIIDTEFDGAGCVHAADIDRDGDLDVLGAGWETDPWHTMLAV